MPGSLAGQKLLHKLTLRLLPGVINIAKCMIKFYWIELRGVQTESKFRPRRCNSLNQLTSVPAVTSIGLCSTSEVITFDQNWHHLYSSSATGEKYFSNDTQIRVISSMEPEVCMEMLRNSSEKLRAKFPAATRGFSLAKFACHGDTFLEVF